MARGAKDLQRLLLDAVKLMGRPHVAEVLFVSEETVQTWLDGKQAMPESHLLALAHAAFEYASRK
jgi:hypothetical protein